MAEVLPGLLEAIEILKAQARMMIDNNRHTEANIVLNMVQELKLKAEGEDTGKMRVIICPSCGAETIS